MPPGNPKGYAAPIRDAQAMSRMGLAENQNKFLDFSNMFNPDVGFPMGESGNGLVGGKSYGSMVNEGFNPMNANPGGYNTPGYTPPLSGKKTGFDFSKFGGMALGGMEGLAALFSAYNAKNALKQGKKQFGFEVASGNRNLANMAKDYNGSLMQRTRDGLALNGITDQENPEYQQRMQTAQNRQVDGSPITA